jgi:hypothetical protein
MRRVLADRSRRECAGRMWPAHRSKAIQRFAMYIVISKPKRWSTACGVSHFMTSSSILRPAAMEYRLVGHLAGASRLSMRVRVWAHRRALRIAAVVIRASRFSLAG